LKNLSKIVPSLRPATCRLAKSMKGQDEKYDKYNYSKLKRFSLMSGFTGLTLLSLIAKNKNFIVDNMTKFEAEIKTELETDRKTDR